MAFEALDPTNGTLIPSKFDQAASLIANATAAGMTVLLRAWPGPVMQPIGALGPSWKGSTQPSNHSGLGSAAQAWFEPIFASFLIVAEASVFFSYTWWYGALDGVFPCGDACSAPPDWYPMLNASLGPPRGPAVRVPGGSGWLYNRSFAFANVSFDAGNVGASFITWGFPQGGGPILPPSPTSSVTLSGTVAPSLSSAPTQLAASPTSFPVSLSAAATASPSPGGRDGGLSPSSTPTTSATATSASAAGPSGGAASTTTNAIGPVAAGSIAAIAIVVLIVVTGGAVLAWWVGLLPLCGPPRSALVAGQPSFNGSTNKAFRNDALSSPIQLKRASRIDSMRAKVASTVSPLSPDTANSIASSVMKRDLAPMEIITPMQGKGRECPPPPASVASAHV